ncbi:hypothetical protein P7F60_12000 [Rhizobium sp. YJ-22]|uniref:hypothetical protein n=1 Tax=Rhizobium sp. YJ-22 TaxID=3037556 RepID=UPI0024121C3C|nr:hypothetical protein [Rhizobium sp. YJ-22]MDG3577115.1 hypothetical protein [Rhizobium sp. YJ-22]
MILPLSEEDETMKVQGLQTIKSSRAAGDGGSITLSIADKSGAVHELQFDRTLVADLINTLLVGASFLKPIPELPLLSLSKIDVVATPHGAVLSLEIAPGVHQKLGIPSDDLTPLRDALGEALEFSAVGRVQ